MNMKEAINLTFKELSEMSIEEFKIEFEKHKEGDIAQIILDSGMLDIYRGL